MNEHDLPPLDGDIRDLIARTRSPEPAPLVSRTRAFDRVAFAIRRPGNAPRHDPSVRSSPAPTRAAPANLAKQVGWWSGTFVVGALVGGLAVHAVEARRASSTTERIVYVERPAATTLPSLAPALSATPSVVASAGPRVALPPSAVRAAPAASSDTFAAERALLGVARSAIEREDGAAALAATNEHERRFRDGLLVQEREAMAVRALSLLGRNDEARARAARFEARFPDSLLLPALQSSIGSSSR